MEEIWKSIKGYEGIYEISNQGKWKSLNYRKTGKEKITKGRDNGIGYKIVTLCKNGKQEVVGVHILVAQAFLPVPEHLQHLIGKKYPSGKPMLEVNHKDENKERNFVYINEDGTVNPEKSNLEWISHIDNCNYGARNRKFADAQSKPVLQFDKQGNFIKEYPSGREIERQTNYNQSNISKCCLGKNKTAYGYIWKFKENCEIEKGTQ